MQSRDGYKQCSKGDDLVFSAHINKSGISVNDNYHIKYPGEVWTRINDGIKKFLRDNLTYMKFSGLRLFSDATIKLNTNLPVLKEYYDKCMIIDLPRVGYEDKTSPERFHTNFHNTDFIFKSDNVITPGVPDIVNNGAILSFSFGKDSLLSYAMLKELGIKTELIFFEDRWDPADIELMHKKRLINLFETEFNETIHIISDNTDYFFDKMVPDSEGIYGCNAMNGYMLMCLPFLYYYRFNQIIFGNEQNLNSYFMDDEGNKCYVSYEQSSEWMKEQNKMLKSLSGDKFKLVSYVEPIFNIAEVKILFNRYPKIAKFTMSCSHNDAENEKNRWCNKCPMCAKMYLYLMANNIDPKAADIQNNFFSYEYKDMYPLFTNKPPRIYEMPEDVRDEQLLAFYLSEKNGAKGKLIDLFKDRFMDEAVKRKDELYKKFYGIHDSRTIPERIREKVIKILKEELGK